jgi:SAM-dependent methyltransferase
MTMNARSTSALVALALAAACARSTSERDSQIGRSTYDGSENMVPASGTVAPVAPVAPAATAENSPLANDAAMTTPPSQEPETAAADAGTKDGGVKDAGSSDAGKKVELDVIYVPTPQPIVDKMLELARVKRDDLVYDLGCGDGRIVVTAAKRYGARAVGFDIDPIRVAEAKKNVEKNKVGHLVTIEQKDIFTLDLTPASVVTLYLLPKLNDRLVPQLEALAPGSRVVSHNYGISGVKPVHAIDMRPRGEEEEHSVFFYTIPFERERSLNLPRPTVPAPRVP